MSKTKKLNYKWITVGLCILMVMISLGFASSTKSLFPDEIAEDLGVERSLVSIGESCRYIATAVVNIFFSFLIAKFGPKKLIVAGFASLVSAMLLYATAENLIMIYIAGTLLGLGFSWTTTTMVGYVVGEWCSENKGTIMGLVLASNGLGGAIAIQIAGSMIDTEVTGSYRAAYFMIAAVIAVTGVILAVFFRNKPKDAPETTKTAGNAKKKRGRDWVGIDFSIAYKRFYFWGALVCIFFSGMILQGTHGIVAMHLKDVGIDYGRVKALLSFGMIILMCAKSMAGFLYDRLGLRFTVNVCTLISIISTFMLASVKGNETGFVIALIYTAVSPFAMPLETVMLPIYASDLFGKKSYAKILGLFVSANTVGFAVGAPVMNLCYDIFGSYVPALVGVGIIMSAVFILLQFVISASNRERKMIIES